MNGWIRIRVRKKALVIKFVVCGDVCELKSLMAVGKRERRR